MTPESQRKMDEEAADGWAITLHGSLQTLAYLRTKDDFLAGIRYCRDTEVKEWKEKYQVANGPFLAKIE